MGILRSAVILIRRRRIRRLVADLAHRDPRRQRRAIESLRGLLLVGKVSLSTDVIEALSVALEDGRDWVLWNAVSVLIDLGPRDGRRLPRHLTTALFDVEGRRRLLARWYSAEP